MIDDETIQAPSRMDLSRVRSLVFRNSTSSLKQLEGLELPALKSFCFFVPEMDTAEFFVPEYPQVAALSVMTFYYPPTLSAYPELTSLCLFVGDILAPSLDSLQHPEKLQTLYLSGYLDTLAGIEKVQNLRHLRLSYRDAVLIHALFDLSITTRPGGCGEGRSLRPVRFPF